MGFIPRFGPRKRHTLFVLRFRTALILFVFVASLPARDRAARVFRAAERVQRSGDTLQAYQLYTQAAALDPSKPQYALHRDALRDWAALAAQVKLVDPSRGDSEDAARRISVEGISPSQAIGGRLALPLPRLRPTAAKTSFDLRGTARPVFEQVAAAYGIQLQFEDGYKVNEYSLNFLFN